MSAQSNPHADTPNEQRWRSVFDRYVLAFSAQADEEAGA
jgi:hypothetical protein